MIFVILLACAALALLAVQLRIYWNKTRQSRVLAQAESAGVAMDEERNIDAEATYAGMLQTEENTGQRFTGRKAQFMELMRICTQGPKSIDEIRFLFAEGIAPVVRPDGVVYVPCIENEHLSIDGEVDLTEEDLGFYIEQGILSHSLP